MPTTIDIDTGGTFTDGFVVHDGTPHTVKVLTTPHDFAVCFREVVEAAADAVGVPVAELLRDTTCVRYATTVGTNTVIQRRGPRLGAVIDAGPGDPRRWGAELLVDPEMVRSPNGGDVDHVIDEIKQLLDRGARGLVVSIAGDDGATAEAGVRAAFERAFPRHCLDTVPLLLGSELTGDADPTRRAATALFNAYVHPEVADYLYRAEDFLRSHGYQRPLLVMHNSGGVSRVAKTIAARTFNSGPTAGLLGARALARELELGDLITLDMGGTSIDVAMITDDRLPMREHGLVEDVVEIGLPLPEILGLGAGGGSIAWLDGDELRVGPRSAGAKPGPACFGLGGQQPTLTDADVVLGVLRPEAFMGGSMRIDVDAAAGAVETIAAPLGITAEQAACRIRTAVHRDVAARLASELRERGIDPAGVTALAFGGNGATHCAEIADLAGIDRMITVPYSPVFSAFGASKADLSHRYEAPEADDAGEALERRALLDMRGEGYGPESVRIERSVAERDGARWTVVEATVDLSGSAAGLVAAPNAAGAAAENPTTRAIHWTEDAPAETTILAAATAATRAVDGPALVDSAMTTCVVPPGWRMTTDERGVAWLARTTGSSR